MFAARCQTVSARSFGLALLAMCATVFACGGVPTNAHGAAADLDPSFSTDGKDVQDLGSSPDTLYVTDAVTDSSNRVVLVGTNTDTGKAMAVRYTSAGVLDATFDGDGIFVATPLNIDSVDSVAIDSAGKIVIGGSMSNDLFVGRLTDGGTVDGSFAGTGFTTVDFGPGNFEDGGSVAVGAGDSIIVGGSTSPGASSDWAVAKLTSAGVLDNSFDGDGKQTVDMSAPGNESVTGVAIDGSSNIVLGGSVGTAFGDADFAVARLTSAGILDSGFSTDGKDTLDIGPTAHSQDFAQDIAIDGTRVVLGGSTGGAMAAVRYTSGGTLDTGFDTDGKATATPGTFSEGNGVVVDGGSRVTVAGSAFGGGGNDFGAVRFTSGGSLDTDFDGDGKLTADLGGNTADAGTAVALDTTARLVIAGTSGVGSATDYAAARFSSTGALDTANFHAPDGYVKTGVTGDSADDGTAVAVDANGRTVVAGTTDLAGTDTDIFVLRYTAGGVLDNSFGTNGVVTTDVQSGAPDSASDVVIDGNGRIVVAGDTAGQFAVLRYTSGGVLDTSFDGDGKVVTSVGFGGSAEAVAIDGSNRIVVGGTVATAGGTDFGVARYLPGGALDTAFDTDGKATVDIASSSDVAADLAIDGTGRIVLAGTSTGGGNPVFAVARLTSAGALDSGFDTDGKQTKSVGGDNDGATSVAIDSTNGLVVAGESFSFAGPTSCDFALVRFTAAGAVDNGFDTDGLVTTDIDGQNACDQAQAVAFDQNGKIVAGGNTFANGDEDFALARYNAATGAVDTSFGGGNGVVTTNFAPGTDDGASGLAVAQTGQLVLAGFSETSGAGFVQDIAVARYDGDPVTGRILNVGKTGAGSGAVTSAPAGINCGGDCSEPYTNGTSVTLTATPDSGSAFASWTGCDNPSGSTCTMDMSGSDKSVTASFTAAQRTLTVNKAGGGSGSVASSPAGITCGGDCSEAYANGTPVTLTATAEGGSTFGGWMGCDSTAGNQCTVNMNADKSVTATFTTTGPIQRTLNVSKAGNGAGNIGGFLINCGTTCSANYDDGMQVLLTAVVTSGSTFTGWTGCDNPSGDQCTMTMNANKSVTATFTQDAGPAQRTLSVSKGGTGTGTVTAPGINCGSDCSEAYPNGTPVLLFASPDTGSTFTGWSGCDSTSGSQCTVSLGADKSVTATFTADSSGGGGDGGGTGGGGGGGGTTTVQCIVPNLKGMKLPAATTALTTAHCALGTVKKKASKGKPGKVIKQDPAAGTTLPSGSKVNVTLSKKKKKRK